MRVLVYYVDFHWDNPQGGSGTNYEFKTMIKIPYELQANSVLDFIEIELERIVKIQRPFGKSEKSLPTIQKVEILK